MKYYYVLVHGRISWTVEKGAEHPRGFYCHRYVFASNEGRATEIAFQKVRRNLDGQSSLLSGALIALSLEAEEIRRVPMHHLLKRDNIGHTFYDQG